MSAEVNRIIRIYATSLPKPLSLWVWQESHQDPKKNLIISAEAFGPPGSV